MNKKELVPKLLGTSPENLGQKVIVTPFGRIEELTSMLQNPKPFKGIIYKGVTGTYNNKKTSIIVTGIGSTLVGDCILSLDSPDIKEVYFIGTAGGLGDLKIGDLLISELAIDGKNFCKYTEHQKNYSTFLGKEYYGSENLINKLPYKTGKVFSIGSLYGESDQFLKYLETLNINAVELEIASFYAACSAMKFDNLALAVISDLPLSKPFWKIDKNEFKPVYSKLKSLFKTIIEL